MWHPCSLTRNRDELQQILRAFGPITQHSRASKICLLGYLEDWGRAFPMCCRRSRSPWRGKARTERFHSYTWELRKFVLQKRKSFSPKNVRLNCKVKLQMKPLKICFKTSCCRWRRHGTILGELLLPADKKLSPEGAGRGTGKMWRSNSNITN